METESIGKLLITYSIPSIISMSATSLYNVVDRIFIGQGVGPLAISGLTLTFPLMMLVTAIGTLVGVGSSARISIVLGMKDIDWARNILGNAFVLTFLLSAVLISLSLCYLDEILVLFGGSENTIPYAKSFLSIVIPGSVLNNIAYSFSGIMRASGFPKKSMYTILVGVLLNVVLAPIFIFGFGMGIRGAAIATVISMFVSSVLVLSHFFNPRHPVHFCRSSWRLNPKIIRNITSIGMAPFLMNVAACAVNIIMNNQLARNGGDLAIGAYGIINSYAILTVMAVMGLCQGMQPIVGYNFGAQRLKRMKDTLLLTIRISFYIMIAGFVACQLFPHYLVRAFTADEVLGGMAVSGMRLAFIMFPVVGFQIVISFFFQSIGRASQAIFISLARQVIFLIPSLYFFSEWFGLTGVWLAIPFSDLMAAVVAIIFLTKEKKIFYPR